MSPSPAVARALPLLLVAALSTRSSAQERSDLVVHEWGTFLSVQGSDAVTLDGVQHEEEKLPRNVYSRTRVGGWPSKMETPVTYFYSPTGMKVRVRVDFPSGLLTQWFPDVAETSPALPPGRRKNTIGDETDKKELPKAVPVLPQNGSLDWGEIEILAPDNHGFDGLLFPADKKEFTWAFARDVDANLIKRGEIETEKFLFYRGLGKFVGALRVHADGEQGLRAQALDGQVAHSVLLLEVNGDRGGFAFLGDVAAGKPLQARWPGATRPLDEMVPAVSSELSQRLVAAGLYAKEAIAMCETWSRQYFRTPGRRALYVLDQALTDKLLPLTVTPAPREIKRVMVGRIECLSLQEEKEIKGLAHDLVVTDATRRKAAREKLLTAGRFTEARLHRALSLVGDEPQARKAVGELIAEVFPLR